MAGARRRALIISQLQARVHMRDQLVDSGLAGMTLGRLDACNSEIDSLLEELWRLSHPMIPSQRSAPDRTIT